MYEYQKTRHSDYPKEHYKESVAYKALIRIGAIYDLEGALRELPPEERLKERQTSIKPLVEEYFAWVKEILENKTLLPKGKAADVLHYSVNQEERLQYLAAGTAGTTAPQKAGYGTITDRAAG